MPIKFKCSCGREISVAEDCAGREAFCPGCRKSVPVPGAELDSPPPADEREASEFKPGALANILGDYLPEKSAAAGAESKEPLRKEEKKKEASPREEKKQEESEPVAGEKKPQKAPAPGAVKGKEEDKESKEKAEAEVPAEEIKVAPASETQDVESTPGIEVFADKIKFHCECGQKVAVRIPAPRGAGTCPRCKRKLKVPAVPGVATRQKAAPPAAGAPTGRQNCSKCGRRIEDSGAAFCPRCGFPLSLLPPGVGGGGGKAPAAAPRKKPAPAEEKPALSAEARKNLTREASLLAAERLRPAARSGGPGPAEELAMLSAEPAGLGRRLGALGLDALATAAVAVSGYQLAGSVELVAALLPAALAAAGAFALLNEVLFAALAKGRSLGMVITGLRVLNHEGRPAGPLLLMARLLATLLLFIGAPLALFDGQRRALHDMVCGTTVRRLLRA